nr:unnamed protein product [Callosobruchus chinensis]CAH7732364.1 unnamed protein product [Callosobruchus chinensis]
MTPPMSEAGRGGGACSGVARSLHHRRQPLRWYSLVTGQPESRAQANSRFSHTSAMGDPFEPNFSSPKLGFRADRHWFLLLREGTGQKC